MKTVRQLTIVVSLLSLLATVALVPTLFSGCATLEPGADPFVVRVEQTQEGAKATLDLAVHLDNADRGFWRTNAPAFHQFCEWLRTPIPYKGETLQRGLEIQENVQDLKVEYKQSRTTYNSNLLWSAYAVLSQAVSQANSWSNIVSSPVHP